MKITKVTVITLPAGTEVVTLWTDLISPAFHGADIATFDTKVPRGTGEAWAKASFPGVPVEYTDCYSGRTPLKFGRDRDAD